MEKETFDYSQWFPIILVYVQNKIVQMPILAYVALRTIMFRQV